MTKSIFSNLPNNLIMDIIKMAEDENKKEQEKLKQKHRGKFINVIHQFLKVEEELCEYYDDGERDQYESEINIDTGERKPGGTFILGDLFWTIKQINQEFINAEEEYYRNEEFDYDDIQYYQEVQAEEDYNNPPENAYYWADELEPNWA